MAYRPKLRPNISCVVPTLLLCALAALLGAMLFFATASTPNPHPNVSRAAAYPRPIAALVIEAADTP